MVFARNNQKRRDRPTLRINALDHRHPFSIPGLCHLGFSTSIGLGYDHTGKDNAHYKAGLVEVEYISLIDPVLGHRVLHKSEPLANEIRIFA
jgi:hypothetical protein